MKPDLPQAMIDLASERLMVEDAAAREAALHELIAAYPEHEVALRSLADDLASVERLLDDEFTEVDPPLPERIGPYRVLHRLGEGAFGTVFLCQQEQPIQRQVAIKVLRPGVGDRQTLARFDGERQLLVQLAHPTIAHVFDAGTLPDSRPYFVMEYVDGEPIRTYCERHALGIGARLRLFLELCRGVEHAHAQGIVHRDLKPANVLIVSDTHGPRPKIIDFGIAKALHRTRGDGGMRTETGRVVGTPGYMSPEQALGRTSEVDERSDVYSLGVMLYELLTGELPYLRNIPERDSEPARPSSRVAAGTKSSTQGGPPSARRQLASALRGDLDWITLKALARDRDARYRKVPDLIDDLERHLRAEPVSAGPPSLRYRMRKFTRRNRAAVTATSLILVTILAGIILTRMAGEAADAKVAAAEAKADQSFGDAAAAVTSLLASASDDRFRFVPDSDSLREALLQQAVSLGERLLEARPTEPDLLAVRSRTLATLAQVYGHLGRFARAEEIADAARADAEALLEARPDSTISQNLMAQAHRQKGRVLERIGKADDALREFTAATGLLAWCHTQDPAQFAVTYSAALRELAGTHRLVKQMEESESAHRLSVEILEQALLLQPDLAQAQHDLGFAQIGLAQQLLFAGSIDEGERLLKEVSARTTRENAELTTKVHTLLGRIALQRRNYEDAVVHLRQGVAAGELWHQQHPHRLVPFREWSMALDFLGSALDRLGAFDEAAQTCREGIALAEKMLLQFPQDPTRIADLAAKQRSFARTLWDRFRQQDLAEAEALARIALDNWSKIPDGVDQRRRVPHWQVLAVLAVVLDSRGRTDEADATWDRVLETLPETVEPSDLLLEVLTGLAHARLRAGRETEAAALVARAQLAIATDRKEFAKRSVEVNWLEAQLAARRGDHAAAAAAAETIVAARGTWFGRRRAGDACFVAWRCAVAAGQDADHYADRAAELYQQVIAQLQQDVSKYPDDPWFVLPYGFSSVRLAQIDAARGDSPRARDRLTATLPLLDRVRSEAHSDMWDEGAYHDGRTLLDGGIR